MYCPLNHKHRLLEIATDLWQCPKCGFGPTTEGTFPFWAISDVLIINHEAEALSVRYDAHIAVYIASRLQWAIDGEEKSIPGSVQEDLIKYISTKEEKEDNPLPATHAFKVGGDTHRGRLSHLQWESPLGEKLL